MLGKKGKRGDGELEKEMRRVVSKKEDERG